MPSPRGARRPETVDRVAAFPVKRGAASLFFVAGVHFAMVFTPGLLRSPPAMACC
jgi:hypothetical protein